MSGSNLANKVVTDQEVEDDEEDLEKLQAEIAKMEEEAARIAKQTEDLQSKAVSSSTTQQNTNKTAMSSSIPGESATPSEGGSADAAAQALRDKNSIYVGQVDYSATPEELLAHFEPCGVVERVTICCDRFSGQPKGFAYLEFATEEAVANAVKLDGSTFKDRQLKVSQKRVNEPGYNFRGGGRGGGRAARGGGRGAFPPRGIRGRGRGRGGNYRGGYGSGGYHPYY